MFKGHCLNFKSIWRCRKNVAVHEENRL